MTTFSTVQTIQEAWSLRKSGLIETRRQTIERRERAVTSALAQGIPNTRREEWKYTSLRPLIDRNFDLVETLRHSGAPVDAQTVELVNSRLAVDAIPVVFVDGRLDLTWPGAEALDPDFFRTLSEAELEEDATFWDEWQFAQGMDHLFAGLNSGLAHEGVVITLNKNQVLKQPIHIVHLATKDAPNAARINRVLISVPENAWLRVYEEFISVHENSFKPNVGEWTNALTQLKLGPSANCGYYRILSSVGSFHTGSVTAVLDKASRLETFSLAVGSRFARINIDVRFTAPDAECVLDGLYLVQGDEHIDHHTTVDHTVGQCKTYQLYKGILADKGRAVFNGKIYLRKDAQGSEAYQTNKNLMLSSDAEVDTKPQLEIDANDVKASHGAAIGSIDAAELFYLRSRCIGEAEATAMLCRGFADECVMKVADPQAKTVLSRYVREWFKFFGSSGAGSSAHEGKL
jgi:Fe-S cluster assembly protein SufD